MLLFIPLSVLLGEPKTALQHIFDFATLNKASCFAFPIGVEDCALSFEVLPPIFFISILNHSDVIHICEGDVGKLETLLTCSCQVVHLIIHPGEIFRETFVQILAVFSTVFITLELNKQSGSVECSPAPEWYETDYKNPMEDLDYPEKCHLDKPDFPKI